MKKFSFPVSLVEEEYLSKVLEEMKEQRIFNALDILFEEGYDINVTQDKETLELIS